jgi:hypothetical protein
VVRLIGGKSWFRTGRDLLLFTVGVAGIVYHLVTAGPSHIQLEVLGFFGTLIGAPYVLGKDESRKE